MTEVRDTDQIRATLSDAHAVEQQALAQLRNAPENAGEPTLAEALRDHLPETEHHEQLVKNRLAELGDSPSAIKDLLLAAGGHGFVLFARSQPDTPGKLATHAYSYEHLELGMYELLGRLADQAGDEATAKLARRIAGDERRMGERLESLMPRTAKASLKDVSDNPTEVISSYLSDAHALEQQSVALLERACDATGSGALHDGFKVHLKESRRHAEVVADRLEQLGASVSRVKDTAMKAGGISWATFFKAQQATPAKVAAFAFAFEHLEIGGYLHLSFVAHALGDEQTSSLAKTLVNEERAAAGTIAGHWDEAVRMAVSS